MFATKSSMLIGLSSESSVRENEPRVSVRSRNPYDGPLRRLEAGLVESRKTVDVDVIIDDRKVCVRGGRRGGDTMSIQVQRLWSGWAALRYVDSLSCRPQIGLLISLC